LYKPQRNNNSAGERWCCQNLLVGNPDGLRVIRTAFDRSCRNSNPEGKQHPNSNTISNRNVVTFSRANRLHDWGKSSRYFGNDRWRHFDRIHHCGSNNFNS
jgi:hypothetical protein